MNPISFEITMTEHKADYTPLFTENVANWPDWVAPTPEEVEAHERHWRDELQHSNYIRAIITDTGSEPKCRLAVESAAFRRDDPQACQASVAQLFGMVSEAVQFRLSSTPPTPP